jgi:hypothetical protein
MYPHTRRAGLVAASALALVAPLALAVPAHADDPGYTVAVNGLDNPRGVAIAANGHVYVAEAGTGGDALEIPSPEGGTIGVGFTGQITSYDPMTDTSSVVVTGLLSAAGEDGLAEGGPAGLTTQGSTVYVIMGGYPGMVPDFITGPEADAIRAQLGRLIKVTPSGSHRTIANVGQFDYDYTGTSGIGIDGDPEAQDANPYGVLALPGRVLVADAGSNTITRVRANGHRSVLTDVPKNPAGFLSDAVPTCVARTGSGDFWVGTLDGQVFRWDGHSALQPSDALSLSGAPLFSIGGCTSDGHGGLFSTDQASFFFGQPGSVVHISPTGQKTTVVGGLLAPAGIALGADGHSLYVATNSILAGAGQLIKIAV